MKKINDVFQNWVLTFRHHLDDDFRLVFPLNHCLVLVMNLDVRLKACRLDEAFRCLFHHCRLDEDDDRCH